MHDAKQSLYVENDLDLKEFFLFMLIHLAVFMEWITAEQYTILMAGGALDGIFSTVIMFWFGQRLTSKWSK